MAATGVVRMTAMDAAEVHANLLPFQLLIRKLCLQATIWYASLPDSHPLAKVVRRASKVRVKRHRAPIHTLFEMHDVQPAVMEKQTLIPENTIEEQTFITTIPERNNAQNIPTQKPNELHIYTDGSGNEENVGAAATMRDGGGQWTEIRYKLGQEEHHTVYKAELMGILLALHLANKNKRLQQVIIFTDNQAAIKV